MSDHAEVKALADELRRHVAELKKQCAGMVDWLTRSNANHEAFIAAERKLVALIADVDASQQALVRIIAATKEKASRADRVLRRLEARR